VHIDRLFVECAGDFSGFLEIYRTTRNSYKYTQHKIHTVNYATTMQDDYRHILIERVHAEARLFRLVKWEFPYFTMVNFETTNDIFARHGCLWNWVHSDWGGTSTTTLFDVYTELNNNVQFVRLQEHICAMALPWRREE